jgi:biopolymer transport protein ExbD
MAFALKRPAHRRSMISVVSMIDVMMILLFFFMVTSTYLNLDMVPALQKADDPAPDPGTSATPSTTLMIRIAADGTAMIGGQSLDNAALTTLLKARLQTDPLTPIVLFPSGAAHLQDLIRTMDVVTRSGAVRVRVIRIEAAK